MNSKEMRVCCVYNDGYKSVFFGWSQFKAWYFYDDATFRHNIKVIDGYSLVCDWDVEVVMWWLNGACFGVFDDGVGVVEMVVGWCVCTNPQLRYF